MKSSPHVLGAASNLLGVALLIATAVHITGRSASVIADEVAFAAAILFIVSCIVSHRAIAKDNERDEHLANKFFFAALLILLFAVLSFWF